MAKFMDRLYKGMSWLILAVSLIGYFAFMILSFEGSIEDMVRDWRSWLHIVFVIYLNITMVTSATDSATQNGIATEEFSLADKLNNEIIESVNNEMEAFREYTKKLNTHELQSIRDDYLFKIGDKTYDELTEKELKAYNKLKPIKHNIYGFNLPLYYEMSRSGEVDYKASIDNRKGKVLKYIQKILFGIMFGGMTINVSFQVRNVGSAFVSLLIIAMGLLATFITIYFPKLFVYKVATPKRVILKKTYYNGFVKYKNGTHKLRELNEKTEIIDNTEKNDIITVE